MSHSETGDKPLKQPTASSDNKRKRPRHENPLQHFDVEKYRDKCHRATCRFCLRILEFEHDCDMGTIENRLKRHFEGSSCVGSEDFREISVSEVTSPAFNQDVARRAVVKYMLLNDLPIAAFRVTPETPFLHPELKTIKSRQVKATIKELYKEEKDVLVEYFKNYSGKIALSCKFWKSRLGLDYIALTAHYIDSDWTLDKRTLAFCLVRKSNAEAVGEAIVSELRNWGIEKKIFSITLGDYDLGDSLTGYLVDYMAEIDTVVFFNTSCFSYVVNSVVQDCLREIKSFVERIIRVFADMTVTRSRRKEFQELCKILTGEDYEIFLPDIGRWDLTSLLLEIVTAFREVVDQYVSGKEDEYPPFSDADWFSATMAKDFVDVFHSTTSRFYSDHTATSCLVIRQMFEISCVFEKYHSDHMLSGVCTDMKRKLRNYYEESPIFFGLSSIIDPRIKLVGLEARLEFIYQTGVGDVDVCTYNARLNDIKSSFEVYFDIYQSQKLQSEQVSPSSSPPNKKPSWAITYKRRLEATRNKKSDLERYLEDPILESDDNEFDVLDWWKSHESSYPVLSTMARDLLMVPVATFFSFSAFHEDVDLLDNERNSVSASMVNPSKCLGDWYKAQRALKMRSVKMEWSSEDEDTEED